MYINIAEFSKHLKFLKVQFVKYDAFLSLFWWTNMDKIAAPTHLSMLTSKPMTLAVRFTRNFSETKTSTTILIIREEKNLIYKSKSQ